MKLLNFYKKKMKELKFLTCLKVYPERFFDILYQNTDIFTTDVNTHFYLHIDFSSLWKEDISEKTRKTIWKYLQLILFQFLVL